MPSRTILVHIRNLNHACFWRYDPGGKGYISLNEAQLCREIPMFRSLNERARKQAFRRFLKSSRVIDAGELPENLPGCRPPRDKVSPSQEELRAGALAFLSAGELFENVDAGPGLMADLLGGLWCRELRAAEPAYRPVVAVDSTAPRIEEILTALVRGVVTCKRWRLGKTRVRRKAVLDYRTDGWNLPRHIQDFSRVKVPVKGHKALRIPCSYENTVALIIGANSQQLQEAAPYLRNGAVFLLNCATSKDLTGDRIRSSALNHYDPEILERLQQKRKRISLLLAFWWRYCRPKRAWRIIQAARASFGPQDSRYIAVTLEPKQLRQAIRYQLLLAFLGWLEDGELLTAGEAAAFRAAFRGVYDPEPVPRQPVRHAEDPEVFLETMRALAAESAISGPDEPYRKNDGCLGAWRDISGTRYLVMPEREWARAYRQKVQTDKSVDTSFFQNKDWSKELQKWMSEAGLIKPASSGHRYRYDLFGNGTRDKTYVLAVPEALLAAS